MSGAAGRIPQARRSFRRLRLWLALAFAALFVACGGGMKVATSDVAGTIPWPPIERLVYDVVDEDGKLLGQETLSVDSASSVDAAGKAESRLRQLFESDTNMDDSEVVVDSRTLKPKSARRRIATKGDTELIETAYTAQGALIKNGDRQSGLGVPEHAYDNDTSLFLWRTLPFREGYEAAYVTIITNRRSRQTVSLRVIGKETVTVPAGRIEAWRLQIKTSNATQTAWYAVEGDRYLVRYDNDRGLFFELKRAP